MRLSECPQASSNHAQPKSSSLEVKSKGDRGTVTSFKHYQLKWLIGTWMKVCRNEESSNSGFVGFKSKQAKQSRSITRRQPESSEHQENGIKGWKKGGKKVAVREPTANSFFKTLLRPTSCLKVFSQCWLCHQGRAALQGWLLAQPDFLRTCPPTSRTSYPSTSSSSCTSGKCKPSHCIL